MKIAILSFYSGLINRGVETYVHELASELARKGHYVTVYQNGKSSSDINYNTSILNLPVDDKEKLGGIPFFNYWSNIIRKFTETSLGKISEDTQVVLTTNGQWQSVLTRKWARKNKITHVIAGQSGPGLDDRINLATTPDSFVALTNYQKEWSRKALFGIRNRIDVIPNGIDIKRFRKTKKIDIELPGPIFLNVGALQDIKRQHLAINAISRLEKGSLLIVGKGPRKEYLEKLGNDKLPGRFMIKDYDYEEMPFVYNSVDAFTFPTSPWESFGIVMLEAMASGLPVVATDDPIRKEIVGEAGIIVNPEDVESYIYALRSSLAKDWGNIPINQAKKYQWMDIAIQYENLFKELTS